MPGFNFPVFRTKVEGVKEAFKLEDPVERKKYFEAKAGTEIEKLRDFLRTNTFVAFLLGPKNSGKGTYTKLFMEAVGAEHVAHISVGDIVRSVHKKLEDPKEKADLTSFLEKRYRGFIELEKIWDIISGRDTKTLLPTEVILALVEREISKMERKAIFIDGFPRNLNQVSYSLYFRSLIGYRDDPDFFIFIEIPNSVLDERIKNRVICPKCQTPRSLKLLRTKEVGYDEGTKEFYLICDTAVCKGARMVKKEGDELGIENIRDRIELDKNIMQKLLELKGVPQVFLRNAVPVEAAKENLDIYELTPAYRYELNDDKSVRSIEEPWMVKDDDGVESYSLLPAPVVLALIKQTVKVLGL